MSAYGNAAVAQSVERRLGKAEVTGSIPVSSFIFLPILKGFRMFRYQIVIKIVIKTVIKTAIKTVIKIAIKTAIITELQVSRLIWKI